ncbi:hypothetical protein CTER_5506, partial [Ruminiclostridium cellobioparum subsp. termitidis CT1112]
MDRVKFYSRNDISCGYYIANIEKLINEYTEGKKLQDINDV